AMDGEVAIVLAGEGGLRGVGGEDGAELQAGATGEPTRLAAVAADDPQVASVPEGHVGLAQRGLLEQQRLLRLRPAGAGCDQEQDNGEERVSHGYGLLEEGAAILETFMVAGSASDTSIWGRSARWRG